jgi:hypothetical protein
MVPTGLAYRASGTFHAIRFDRNTGRCLGPFDDLWCRRFGLLGRWPSNVTTSHRIHGSRARVAATLSKGPRPVEGRGLRWSVGWCRSRGSHATRDPLVPGRPLRGLPRRVRLCAPE